MTIRRKWRTPYLGVSYEETLVGAYYLANEPHRQRPIVVSLTAGARSLVGLVRSRAVDVTGVLAAEGLTREATARGAIRLSRDGLSARIAYEITFESDDRERLVLAADKRFDHRNPYASLTVLAGTISDELGSPRASCLLRFDARSDLGAYLRSFRLNIALV